MPSPRSFLWLSTLFAMVCVVQLAPLAEASAQQLRSQETSEGWLAAQPWPVHAFVYGGALGFAPGAKHGGVALGSSLTYWEKGAHTLIQSLEVGYVHQKHFARGGTLDTSLAYRYCLRGIGLCGKAGPLLGGELLHYPGVVYGASPSGEFEARRSTLEPNMRVGVAVTLDKDLCKWTGIPMSLFISYREVVLTGFLPEQGLPLFARTQLGGGVSVRPKGCA